jgi:hypothetical protein
LPGNVQSGHCEPQSASCPTSSASA